MTIETCAATVASPGKYLSFQLGGEEYGVEILKVQEINGITQVTRVPRTPDFVRGVINLRGKVIPVVDLRAKFGMEAVEDTEKTCNIVVQLRRDDEKVTMGVIVDDVSEVLDIKEPQIAPPPSFGSGIESDFIIGMAKIDKNVVILLDIERVLSWEDWRTLSTVKSAV
jgi:purine-binding chemotaxis protein CheW